MTASKPSNVTLLDKVLEGKDPDFQARVLDIVARFGLKPTDPLFLIMVSVGQLQLLLEQSPKDLDALFNQWSEALYDKLQTAERVAVKGQQTAIAGAVKSLIQKTEWEGRSRLFSSVVPAAGLLSAAIGVGILLGMSVPVWLQGGYVTQPRRLTLAQAEALRWAESREGQLARNIMKWNVGSLDNLDCLNDVKHLNVTLRVQGRLAASGFCVLWTQPPSQRKFVSKSK